METKQKNTKLVISLLVLVLVVWMGGLTEAAPIGTAWTYQGRLMDGEKPADGLYDFSFSLWSDPCDVNDVYKIGETLNIADWDVIDGYFTVDLDFNDVNAFNGEQRWLEIGIRPGELADPNAYTTLGWRMEIKPAPYALSLPGLRTEQNEMSTNLIGGYRGNTVTKGVVGAVIGGGGESGYVHSVTDNYSTIGGGRYNKAGDDSGTADDASYATVGGGYGNRASGKLSTVGGGFAIQATAYGSVVGGGLGNRAVERYATVGGGYDNYAGGEHATVGGGKYNGATGSYASVGGGEVNGADEDHSTVAGGHYNTAQGRYSTISGGDNNLASGHESAIGGGDDNYTASTHSTVSGGHSNSASGHSSSVGGGWDNSARGSYSTIPGGYTNEADGNWSFAAGANAKARHEGSFVWADSDYYTEFVSTGSDQFLIRASGGVGIGTNSPTEALDVDGAVKAVAFIGDGNGLTNLQIDSGWTVDGQDMYSSVSGNIGIGTESPSYPLHVEAGYATLHVGSTIGHAKTDISRAGSSWMSTLDFLTGGAINWSIGTGMLGDNDFSISKSGYGNVQFTIENTSDNVGIGTSTPQNRLDIEGGVAVGTSYSGSSAAPANGMIVQGNVGVGTTNPVYPLEVKTTADNIFATGIENESATGHGLSVRVGSSGTEGAFQVYRDEGIASTLIKVQANGNVGIGTSSPGEKLDVNGNVKLGTGEDLYAPGTPSNSKILRGYILGDGTAMWSEGVTSQKTGTGAYSVTFDNPFSSVPTVVTTTFGGGSVSSLTGFNANSFSVQTRQISSGSVVDAPFTFIVIGPR